jgi:hypothetical protein
MYFQCQACSWRALGVDGYNESFSPLLVFDIINIKPVINLKWHSSLPYSDFTKVRLTLLLDFIRVEREQSVIAMRETRECHLDFFVD